MSFAEFKQRQCPVAAQKLIPAGLVSQFAQIVGAPLSVHFFGQRFLATEVHAVYSA